MNHDCAAIGALAQSFNFPRLSRVLTQPPAVLTNKPAFRPWFLCLVLCGFCLQACHYDAAKTAITDTAYLDQIVTTLTRQHHLEAPDKNWQMKALNESVKTLMEDQDALGTQADVKAAIDALAQGNTDAAKSLFAKLAENPESEAKEAAGAFRNLGVLASLNNVPQALSAYRRAAELESGNSENWDGLGHLLNQTGNAEAIAAFAKALAIAKTTKNQLDMATAYGNLADAYQAQRQWDKALEMLNKALPIHQASGNQQAVAENYARLGDVCYNSRDRLEQAKTYYEKALQMNESGGYQAGVALQYANLGNVYQKLGNSAKAIEKYQKSMQIYQHLGDKTGIALSSRNLGILHKGRNELPKALEMLQKALEADERAGDKSAMAFDYSNLGSAYLLQGNKAEAAQNYRLCLELLRILNDPESERIQDLLDEM